MHWLLLLLLCTTAWAQNSGHWELVKTANLGSQAHSIAPRMATREYFQGDSKNGKVEGHFTRYFDEQHQTLDLELAAEVTWTPPPARCKPGDKWDGAYAGKTTKRYDRNAQNGLLPPGTVTLSVDTSQRYVDSFTRPTPGYWNQPVGFFVTSDSKASVPQKTSIFTFPGPAPNPDHYLLVQANVQLSMGGSDTYNYCYKWVPDAPREHTGHLRCLVSNSHSGAMVGLVLKFKNIETGKPFELVTDKQGEAKFGVTAKTTSGAIRARLEQVEITPDTRYVIPMEGTIPSYVRAGGTLVLPLKKDLEFSAKNSFKIELPIRITLFKQLVLALKWDHSRDSWQRCQSNVLVSGIDGKKLLQCGTDAFKGSGDTLALDLYLPTAELLKLTKLSVFGYEPKDKLTDLQTIAVPTAKTASTPHLVTLQLCDTATRVARLKYQVYKYFLPLLGKERARRIAEVKVQVDASGGKISYLDGVMHIPGTIDLTKDEFSETFMHEWTHHLMAIVGPDPDIEDRLGGRHDVWVRSPYPELAWDEGRAHFCSVVLTRGLQMPYNPQSFSKASAKGPTSSAADAGDSIEGVITVALIDFYASSGYTKTQDVMRNFLEVNDHAISTLGHPPRTSSEFFRVQKELIKARMADGRLPKSKGADMMQTADKVSKKYKVSP